VSGQRADETSWVVFNAPGPWFGADRAMGVFHENGGSINVHGPL
jgi:hypothetical protein